jgi:hypothetical protein
MTRSNCILFKNRIIGLAGVALALTAVAGCFGPSGASSAGESGSENNAVIVNGKALSLETLHLLEVQYGVRAQPGRYWYDNLCGAVGYEGQGTAGFLPAGLGLGGPLQADASNGSSGVFVNGRELTAVEADTIRRLTPVRPGRYWLDGRGNAGVEGGPAECNLAQLARRSQSAHSWRSNTTGIGVVGQGNFVGIIGDGWSVTTGN